MWHLVSHLVRENLDQIVENSFLHCHVPNLHSIMLLDSPDKSIRLFVAEPGHTLENNFPDKLTGKPLLTQSVGFHSHRRNLTLSVVRGRLYNWTVKECKCKEDDASFEIEKFVYSSKIKSENKETKFVSQGMGRMKTVSKLTELTPNMSSSMPADLIHTVACYENQITAWFVFEGKEDKCYEPVCYSVSNPDKQNFDHLYKKPTEKDVIRILKSVELLSKDF